MYCVLHISSVVESARREPTLAAALTQRSAEGRKDLTMPKKLRSLTAAQKQRAYRLTSANDRVSENASRDGAYATFSSDELLRAAERSTTNEELQQLSKLIGERATIRLRAQMLIDQYAGDLVAAQYEAMRMRELQSPSSFAHTEWRGIVNMIRYARIVRRQLT